MGGVYDVGFTNVMFVYIFGCFELVMVVRMLFLWVSVLVGRVSVCLDCVVMILFWSSRYRSWVNFCFEYSWVALGISVSML